MDILSIVPGIMFLTRTDKKCCPDSHFATENDTKSLDETKHDRGPFEPAWHLKLGNLGGLKGGPTTIS